MTDITVNEKLPGMSDEMLQQLHVVKNLIKFALLNNTAREISDDLFFENEHMDLLEAERLTNKVYEVHRMVVERGVEETINDPLFLECEGTLYAIALSLVAREDEATSLFAQLKAEEYHIH